MKIFFTLACIAATSAFGSTDPHGISIAAYAQDYVVASGPPRDYHEVAEVCRALGRVIPSMDEATKIHIEILRRLGVPTMTEFDGYATTGSFWTRNTSRRSGAKLALIVTQDSTKTSETTRFISTSKRTKLLSVCGGIRAIK